MSMNDAGGSGGGGFGVPPIEPGDLSGFGPQAKWPTVLGWFSIVQGGLGVLANGCCSIFLILGMSWFESFLRNMPKPGGGRAAMPGQDPVAAANTMALMRPWTMAQGALAFVTLGTSVWLLVAGIRMVQRRRVSVGLHKGWAPVRLGLAVVGGLIGVLSSVMTAERQAEIQQAQGVMTSATAVMVQGVLSAVVFTLVVMVYPVVVLVVLRKAWAKEEVARWTSGEGVAVEDDLDFK